MAKKKETKIEIETPQVQETVVMEEPVVKTPKIEVKPKKDKWEIKDRMYYLSGRQKPLSRSIKACDLFWFDKELGYEREIKYCQNQRTVFVDEMKGEQRLEHIVFRSGTLFVPKEQTTLQKFLSLYHPHKDKLFYEHSPRVVAENQLEWLEFEVEALGIAKSMDIEMAEAIMRVEKGSEVSNLSSKELKRDLLLFARNNPKLFIELTADDNVQLRNFGIKATEAGIISLSNDQRHFIWNSNNRKIMTVPFDEHPYSALAAWFKTDEGMEIYANIEKRLN
tara:strand:- start:7949 stop:8785 length:837 start_codon:yes stop_codon:yes gene_type:complete